MYARQGMSIGDGRPCRNDRDTKNISCLATSAGNPDPAEVLLEVTRLVPLDNNEKGVSK